MKQMTDHEVGQAMDLTTDLLAKRAKDGDNFHISVLSASMLAETGYGNMTVAEMKEIVRLAGRIVHEMPSTDEPRFSMHDYADAIVNARSQVSYRKLLDLDDESFAAAMIWLAADKRETYSGEAHVQEPLELDVYMDCD